MEKSEAALREEKILQFWEDRGIFKKSLEKPSPKGEFVFYEGPPTANGRPGIHHLESRAFKDAIPRYKTMRGYRVPRRAGWDTHGLPVELEVEKELGFSGKKEIETYGIAAFNRKCRESVLRYIGDWEVFTKRMGYWVDASKAYFTFDASYMEAVWGVFKTAADSGRLYKDYKVVPWCPRCETALSSHELAQGYEDVSDLSVTAKFELVDEPGTYVVAWTTTPWTLPGNVGLAVGPNIKYGIYIKEGVKVIVADARASVLGEGWERSSDAPDLVGKAYKPLYDFLSPLAEGKEKENLQNAWKIYAADFVTTEDGTGVVHTAVMYGQDDFALGQKVGLPKVHLVAPNGRYVSGTGFLENRFVRDEEVAVDIIKDLAGRGLLFSKAKYQHTYPFCWRCKTALIYYARDSWYFRMTDLAGELSKENKGIHWEPSHFRDGRMGEWLANVKDWAISRERYWATPLPVWRSEDGDQVVIGSVEELKARTKKSGNTYFFMRHGQSETNVRKIASVDAESKYPLTAKGRGQAVAAAKKLSGVTRIYTSPVLRARETAEIVAEEVGFPKEEIIVDDRLREYGFGDLEGKSITEFQRMQEGLGYADPVPGGESYQDVKNRVGDFLYEIETALAGETVLIVTHGAVNEVREALASGADKKVSKELVDSGYVEAGTVSPLAFVPLPHNERYELDLHRPYIDDVVLLSDSGKAMRRTPEVMDVWFDSGAMPFAQNAKDRKPGSLKDYFDTVPYPGQYISEAIDQTRGWFYTLLAVGVLMGRGASYKNVICLGHLLDAEGKKMSKSKGNVVVPGPEMDKWGVDTIRFWMYSVNQPGDSKNYDEKTMKEASRTLSWLTNSAKFYELFAADKKGGAKKQFIDRWMEQRVADTVRAVTEDLEGYKLYEAATEVASLCEDLSQWYVRRIRDRAKEGDAAAIGTLRHALKSIALLVAPFAPFIAEDVYQVVKQETDPESVHLAQWPVAKESFLSRWFNKDTSVAEMKRVRSLASEALMLRQKAGSKVRQPLASLSIPGTLSAGAQALLAEEVNVKQIICNAPELALDTNLTTELIREGDEREMLRAVAEARKTLGLSPKDRMRVDVNAEGAYAVELSTGTQKFDLVPDAA